MKSVLGKLAGISPWCRWLILLMACYLLASLTWHRIDHRPPRWDESHYLGISQHSYRALQHRHALGALRLQGVTAVKPGLVPFLSALSYFVVGDDETTATFLLNTLSLLVIFYSVLRVGQELTERASVGALACLLFCAIPTALLWSRYYQADLPLTAAVCCTVWLCWAIDRSGFQDRTRMVLLGLAIAFGMGAKHLYVGFVMGPLALLVGRAVVRQTWPLRISLRQRWLLVGCLGGGIMAGGLYHLLNFHIIREQLLRSQNPQLTGAGAAEVAAARAWPCLLRFFEGWCMPPALAGGLFLVSLLACLCQRRWRVLYLLLCVVGGYLCVARVASVPLPYYFLPLAPFALLISCAVVALPAPGDGRFGKGFDLGRGCAIALAVALLLSHDARLLLGTGNPLKLAARVPGILLAKTPVRDNPLAGWPYWANVCPDGNFAVLPYPLPWPAEDMLARAAATINTAGRPAGRKCRIGFYTALHEWLSADLFLYKIRQRGLAETLELVPLIPGRFGDEPLPPDLTGCDFLVLKTGEVCKWSFYGTASIDRAQRYVSILTAQNYRVVRRAGFTLVRRYDLPDGTEGSVWVSPYLGCRSRSLLEELPAAECSCPDLVNDTVCDVNGEVRPVLCQHPAAPGRICSACWKGVDVGTGSRFVFGVAVNPAGWEAPVATGGVELVVEARDGARCVTLFRKHIDPKHNAAERRWLDFAVPLDRWAGKKVDLVLKTLPGPEDYPLDDWAGWSGLRVVTP